MQAGVDGLLRDKTRQPCIPPLGAEIVERVMRLTLLAAAWRNHELEGIGDGQSQRHQRQLGAAHLAQPWPAAAPNAAVQALEQSVPPTGIATSSACTSICRPCRGPVDRREEPNPGPRPHPGWPAAQARPLRHHAPTTSAMASPPCSPRWMWPRKVIGRCMQRHRIRSSSTSSTSSRPRFQPASWCTPSSATTRPTSIQRSSSGSADIRAEFSLHSGQRILA